MINVACRTIPKVPLSPVLSQLLFNPTAAAEEEETAAEAKSMCAEMAP